MIASAQRLLDAGRYVGRIAGGEVWIDRSNGEIRTGCDRYAGTQTTGTVVRNARRRIGREDRDVWRNVLIGKRFVVERPGAGRIACQAGGIQPGAETSLIEVQADGGANHHPLGDGPGSLAARRSPGAEPTEVKMAYTAPRCPGRRRPDRQLGPVRWLEYLHGRSTGPSGVANRRQVVPTQTVVDVEAVGDLVAIFKKQIEVVLGVRCGRGSRCRAGQNYLRPEESQQGPWFGSRLRHCIRCLRHVVG